MAVSISLADDIDVSRETCSPTATISPWPLRIRCHGVLDGRRFRARAGPGLPHQTHHPHHSCPGREPDYRLDINTLHRDKGATALKLNELGRVTLRTQVPLLLDEYSRNAATGSFILIDSITNVTVAAGMVRATRHRHRPAAPHRTPFRTGRL